jgi:polar amino acid transport system substrate-binding protein
MPMIRSRRRWAALAILLLAATAHADQLADVLQRRVLRVAVPSEFPPFGFIYKGVPDGYDIAVARMLALDLGVRAELVPVSSPERIPALESGKVDVIVASLGRTPEREKVLDFSMAYAPLYLGVFGDRDARPPAGFAGRRIGVSKGSVEEAELLRRAPQAAIVRLENSKAIIEAYLKHDIEFMAVGSAVIESVTDVGARDRLRLHLMLKDSPCYIGVRKGEAALLARVDKFLKDASDSQAMTVNAMVWFKSTLPPDFFRQAQDRPRP